MGIAPVIKGEILFSEIPVIEMNSCQLKSPRNVLQATPYQIQQKKDK